jgi:hypothetical protein
MPDLSATLSVTVVPARTGAISSGHSFLLLLITCPVKLHRSLGSTTIMFDYDALKAIIVPPDLVPFKNKGLRGNDAKFRPLLK